MCFRNDRVQAKMDIRKYIKPLLTSLCQTMPKTRDNHYVPEWYQKGFLSGKANQLHYLDLAPDTKRLTDGRIITMNCRSMRPTSKCFYQTDLYTTFFGQYINDEIERILFGQIDNRNPN